jgi:hypothetical protein
LQEWKVLTFLRRELHNKEIAEQLGISVNTVRTHVSSILAKLGLDKRGDVMDWPGMPDVWGLKGKAFGESTMQLAIYMTAIRVKSLEASVPFYDGLLGQTGILVTPGRHYYYLGGVALALREPYAHGLEPLPTRTGSISRPMTSREHGETQTV